MISSLTNGVLFVALVLTSLIVVSMYRKLKNFENHHAEYGDILAKTVSALADAQLAIENLNADGRSTAFELGERIEEARLLIKDIDARQAKSAA